MAPVTTPGNVNYYEILEVPSDADEREIKRAYYRLARDLHPDKASSPEEMKSFEERFAQVSAAYNVLKDEAKRAEYDRKMKARPNIVAGTATPTSRPTPTSPAATPVSQVINAQRGVPNAGASTTTTAQKPRQSLGVTPEKAAIAQKAFAKGMQLYREGNFAKAIDFFEAAIQNNDGEAIYHARLASAVIQARRSATRAINAAQRAIELDPYNLEHKFTLAHVFETIGSKSNAEKIYEDILRWDQGNPRAQACLANLKRKGFHLFSGRMGNGLGGGVSSGAALFDRLMGLFRR